MGLDYHVSVGPYVQCKVLYQEKESNIFACSGKTCTKYGERCSSSNPPKFCDRCGSPIGEMTIRIKEKVVGVFELIEDICEALYSSAPIDDGVDIWLSNRHRPNPESREFSFNPKSDYFITEIKAEDIVNDLREFEQQYASALKHIRQAYGEENVEVKWGVVSYAN